MHSTIRSSRSAIAVGLGIAAIAFSASAQLLLATPAEELDRAVHAAGSTGLSAATPERFAAAFTAVTARLKLHELPDYVTAAIRLRPDLSTQITACSIRAAIRRARNHQVLKAATDLIVRAAILANSEAAVDIVEAAVRAAPSLRDVIAAAAITAAPQGRLAILEATAAVAPLTALSHRPAAEGDFSAGYGSAIPIHISDISGDVNSPEQPPTGR